MNVVNGRDFDLLRYRAINLYGIKKYMVTLKNGNKINFGDQRYEDYLQHQDWKRRIRYRRRASKIRDKEGELTYKDPNSANFWSYHLL